MKLALLIFFAFNLFYKSHCNRENYDLKDENALNDYLTEVYEKEASQIQYRNTLAQWDFNTDINNKTKEDLATKASLDAAEFAKRVWKEKFKDLNVDDYKSKTLKRQIKMLKDVGTAILDEDKLKNLTETLNKLTNLYSAAKVCPYHKQQCDIEKDGMSLTPDIEKAFEKSRDYEELAYYWKAWRDASGARMPDLYQTYVALTNEAAVANGFKDAGEYWRDSYESKNFTEEIDALWAQIAPFYGELHKYAGLKLKAVYGDQLNSSDGLLPAHVFGNMWAQSWNNIADLLRPFPNASKVDVTGALARRNFTVLKMFTTADEFYKSMGLLPNDICYNTSLGAMIEKPVDGRAVVCHASAWDFSNGRDFRIKMCTNLDGEDFTVIHHEMGHIQYFLQYAGQPAAFRDGANPGFHEAIGDTVALSVNTPKHLRKVGLLPEEYAESEEASLNALMDAALAKVAFLPFGLLVDKWRWDVFSGAVPRERWNQHWWDCKAKYQKVKPPVERSGERDFDPGAKYHVPGDSQYIAYFVAHILQFQFYKSFCVEAGEYNPDSNETALHECDFYQSIAAGEKLRDGLKLGSSKHWSEVLEVMTGETELNAGPLLEYFKPLYDYLKEYNAKHG